MVEKSGVEFGYAGLIGGSAHWQIAQRYQAVAEIVRLLGPLDADERRFVLNLVQNEAALRRGRRQ